MSRPDRALAACAHAAVRARSMAACIRGRHARVLQWQLELRTTTSIEQVSLPLQVAAITLDVGPLVSATPARAAHSTATWAIGRHWEGVSHTALLPADMGGLAGALHCTRRARWAWSACPYICFTRPGRPGVHPAEPLRSTASCPAVAPQWLLGEGRKRTEFGR
jgi:hypothetical protein